VTTVHTDRHTEAMSEREIGMREGRAEFGELISRAEYGGEITYVTRHGRRVAAIVPLDRIAAPSTGAPKTGKPSTGHHEQ
jgi:prevent-host-death family protein